MGGERVNRHNHTSATVGTIFGTRVHTKLDTTTKHAANSTTLVKTGGFWGQLKVAGLPWIWISMDISMCGYQTLAISMDIYGYLWIFYVTALELATSQNLSLIHI